MMFGVAASDLVRGADFGVVCLLFKGFTSLMFDSNSVDP